MTVGRPSPALPHCDNNSTTVRKAPGVASNPFAEDLHPGDQSSATFAGSSFDGSARHWFAAVRLGWWTGILFAGCLEHLTDDFGVVPDPPLPCELDQGTDRW